MKLVTYAHAARCSLAPLLGAFWLAACARYPSPADVEDAGTADAGTIEFSAEGAFAAQYTWCF